MPGFVIFSLAFWSKAASRRRIALKWQSSSNSVLSALESRLPPESRPFHKSEHNTDSVSVHAVGSRVVWRPDIGATLGRENKATRRPQRQPRTRSGHRRTASCRSINLSRQPWWRDWICDRAASKGNSWPSWRRPMPTSSAATFRYPFWRCVTWTAFVK